MGSHIGRTVRRPWLAAIAIAVHASLAQAQDIPDDASMGTADEAIADAGADAASALPEPSFAERVARCMGEPVKPNAAALRRWECFQGEAWKRVSEPASFTEADAEAKERTTALNGLVELAAQMRAGEVTEERQAWACLAEPPKDGCTESPRGLSCHLFCEDTNSQCQDATICRARLELLENYSKSREPAAILANAGPAGEQLSTLDAFSEVPRIKRLLELAMWRFEVAGDWRVMRPDSALVGALEQAGAALFYAAWTSGEPSEKARRALAGCFAEPDAITCLEKIVGGELEALKRSKGGPPLWYECFGEALHSESLPPKCNGLREQGWPFDQHLLELPQALASSPSGRDRLASQIAKWIARGVLSLSTLVELEAMTGHNLSATETQHSVEAPEVLWRRAKGADAEARKQLRLQVRAYHAQRIQARLAENKEEERRFARGELFRFLLVAELECTGAREAAQRMRACRKLADVRAFLPDTSGREDAVVRLIAATWESQYAPRHEDRLRAGAWSIYLVRKHPELLDRAAAKLAGAGGDSASIRRKLLSGILAAQELTVMTAFLRSNSVTARVQAADEFEKVWRQLSPDLGAEREEHELRRVMLRAAVSVLEDSRARGKRSLDRLWDLVQPRRRHQPWSGPSVEMLVGLVTLAGVYGVLENEEDIQRWSSVIFEDPERDCGERVLDALWVLRVTKRVRALPKAKTDRPECEWANDLYKWGLALQRSDESAFEALRGAIARRGSGPQESSHSKLPSLMKQWEERNERELLERIVELAVRMQSRGKRSVADVVAKAACKLSFEDDSEFLRPDSCQPPPGPVVQYLRYAVEQGDEPEYAYAALYYGGSSSPTWRLVPLGSASPIDQRIERFQRNVSRPSGAIGQVAAQLYEALWRPLGIPKGSGDDKLHVFPTGPLRALPFGALLGPEGPLDEDHLLIVQHRRSNPLWSDPQTHGKGERALIVGDPDFELNGSRAPGATLAKLQYLRDELGAVRSAFSTSSTHGDCDPVLELTGREASELRVRVNAYCPVPWGTLHIATHGIYGESQATTEVRANSPGAKYGAALLLSGSAPHLRKLASERLSIAGSDSAMDGILTADELYRIPFSVRDLPPRLVVLSACGTARGVPAHDHAVDSMLSAFLLAGTEQVVASLWSVSDRATAFMMANFYSYLTQGADGNGAGTEEALRRARREVRKRYPHPFYWAPFVTVRGAAREDPSYRSGK